MRPSGQRWASGEWLASVCGTASQDFTQRATETGKATEWHRDFIDALRAKRNHVCFLSGHSVARTATDQSHSEHDGNHARPRTHLMQDRATDAAPVPAS